MAGRPSEFDPEIMERVIDGLEDGIPLRVQCRTGGMPSYKSIYRWADAHPEYKSRIADARAKGWDIIAEDCIDIADDGRNDTVIDHNGNPRPNTEWIARSKLRVDTRLKLLSKWDPKRYGDRMELRHGDSDGKPLAAIINVTIGGKKPDDAA